MKVALCFIISYEHILNKEEIWKEWIEPNKDIINVYFYYKDLKKIKSPWIMDHTVPPSYISETSYFHVIPAYMSVMNFAFTHDIQNQWFCLLTDSCCPIISPKRFRYLFYNNYNKSIMSWKKAWWNINFHKRANLALIPEEYHLANDPWFVLKRENVAQCFDFLKRQPKFIHTICSGGLANESLFAIIMKYYKQLETNNVISSITHLTDWSRMTSSTSPHLFIEANKKDITFINDSLEKNTYSMFIRKISPDFPDEKLRYYIYEYNKENYNKLVIREPIEVIYKRVKECLLLLTYYVVITIFIIYIFKYFWYSLYNGRS